VGFDDLADETTQGLVKRMISLSDAVASLVSVVVADASAAPATYTQAHTQSLVDLSNANKAAINLLVSDLNNAIIVLNDLILKSKNSGQMT
jgi:2-phospho-L-lactate guanylyltransferase (CobY/MobA/RfbA family)